MKWISLFVVTLLASASVLLLSACGKECTAIGSRCELVVALDHTGWEPGTYVFEADGGGDIESCTVTLPREGEEGFLPCLNGWWTGNGSGMTADGYPSRLIVNDPPTKVAIRITYEGTVIANQTLKPRYKETEPNGEGCGICRNAEVAMEF